MTFHDCLNNLACKRHRILVAYFCSRLRGFKFSHSRQLKFQKRILQIKYFSIIDLSVTPTDFSFSLFKWVRSNGHVFCTFSQFSMHTLQNRCPTGSFKFKTHIYTYYPWFPIIRMLAFNSYYFHNIGIAQKVFAYWTHKFIGYFIQKTFDSYIFHWKLFQIK